MSVQFPPAIPGPEMAAPILWAPCNFGFFLLEKNPMPVKFLLLGGGGVLGFLGKGGWKCQYYFYGHWHFCKLRIFRRQPGLKWKFLLRRTWSGQTLLPLQLQDFHSLSEENQVFLVKMFFLTVCPNPVDTNPDIRFWAFGSFV